ncbi:hypothetical protein F7734_38155 [Scytonema sp. UIC 10036]|uniref:hypothetical protein n=1 Tax=Scytonema sp. UIC 10036 TaxID=2304196 RepID=UPI0012DA4974|nr:hypothetical protein [Scytonema sp. UIC 10036]MUG97824.1 hypothetical protein [Scytonema sp. UIC 10036]
MTHKIVIQVAIPHLFSGALWSVLCGSEAIYLTATDAEDAEVRGEKAINFLKFCSTLTGRLWALPTFALLRRCKISIY